jgi:predicted metal-dependent enzyme (double-stranded beta helix superfamily)
LFVLARDDIPTSAAISEALARVIVQAAHADRVEGIARALGGDIGSLLDVRFPTDPLMHCRTVLFSDAQATVVLIAWLPGQFSDIHDHDGVECVFRVLRGIALEQRYSLDGDGHARLVSEDRYLPGSVVLSTDEDIHALGNDAASAETLITLHVYRPEARMRVYRPARGEAP